MDDGIWANWYDLDDEDKDSHLTWLHETYLPEIVSLPGIAWAAHYALDDTIYKGPRERLTHTDDSIGQGIQYLVLVGATTPHVFFHTRSPVFVANQSKETQDRLAQRRESRFLIATEEARVTGPDYDKAIPGGTPGPAIQMGSYRMTTPEAEIGIGEWYAQFRLPKLARTPGCLRVRKLVGIAGWAKHAILYEFTSLEDRRQNIEKPYDEWTARAVKSTIHAPGSPAVGARTWPSV